MDRNEYMRNWFREFKKRDPEKYDLQRRKARLKLKYGITIEDYEAMFVRQGGKCALCERTPADERYDHLNVDYCRDTGRVRGLLCTVHNSALAALGDNEDGLIKAIAYLNLGKD